jgi:hypothetical protein
VHISPVENNPPFRYARWSCVSTVIETFRQVNEIEYSQGKAESQGLTTKKETIYNTQRETFRFMGLDTEKEVVLWVLLLLMLPSGQE